ncbi:MAG: hypothetical protein MK142_18020 [Pseudomonadales bacterium]|nr:hypothetical protein [Pseudomonadales bacterium]
MSEATHAERGIAASIARWDAFGIHRTGTDADRATGLWLRDAAAALGHDARIEAFPLRRRTPTAATLTLADGSRIDGVPLFDGGQCPDGLDATLGGEAGQIPVLRTPPYDAMPGARALDDARHAATHPAIIAVTDDRHVRSGLALLNAESFHAPFGPPVLQVGSEHLPRLEGARGSAARMHIGFEQSRVEASNVRVDVSGRDPSLAPVVVITPRSSWWHSTSERGGGIALWLDLLAHFAAHPPRRPLVFTANTGHELGHVGMQRFLDVEEALVRGAHCWVHLGANFAAVAPGQVRIQAASAALMDAMDRALADEGVTVGARTEVGAAPYGEARDIDAGHGAYVSILGSNGLFHHPEDRWPDSVDLPRTLAIARAFRTLTGALAEAA